MTVFHISDCKKYTRCPRMYVLDKNAPKREFRPFVRLDEQVTEIAGKKLGVQNCFIGERGDDPEKAIAAMQSYEWLAKARFEYDRLRIKVPFMHRTEKGWDLYFLFIGLFPRTDDMQFYCDTVWVLQNNNIPLHDIRIIHLNADYVRGKELDPEQLFIISDFFYNANNNPTVPVKQAIMEKMKNLTPLLDEMDSVDESVLQPPVRTSKCAARQKCRYYDQCFPDEQIIPNNSILTLIASSEKYAMEKDGIRYLRDADENRIEGTRMQYAQIMADKNGGFYADQIALRTWLDNIHYPIAFLDFEWERFAIPPYEGMRPYDVLPFEYSIHVLHEDGSVYHNVFLSVHDDRRELVESMLKDIPESGSVVAYNAVGAEMIRIQEFAEQFPEYRDKLLAINERMEDLQLPFITGTVYDVRMAGQWSLKKIMAMMDDKAYKELDINQGMDAVFEWRHLDHDEDLESRDKIIDDLKRYCGMDSYAMIVVYKWLCEKAA